MRLRERFAKGVTELSDNVASVIKKSVSSITNNSEHKTASKKEIRELRRIVRDNGLWFSQDGGKTYRMAIKPVYKFPKWVDVWFTLSMYSIKGDKHTARFYLKVQQDFFNRQEKEETLGNHFVLKSKYRKIKESGLPEQYKNKNIVGEYTFMASSKYSIHEYNYYIDNLRAIKNLIRAEGIFEKKATYKPVMCNNKPCVLTNEDNIFFACFDVKKMLQYKEDIYFIRKGKFSDKKQSVKDTLLQLLEFVRNSKDPIEKKWSDKVTQLLIEFNEFWD